MFLGLLNSIFSWMVRWKFEFRDASALECVFGVDFAVCYICFYCLADWLFMKNELYKCECAKTQKTIPNSFWNSLFEW